MVETESFELIRYCVLCEAAVGFQIPIGLKHRCGLVFRPLSERDVPSGHLLLGQRPGRTLPVASAWFVTQLSTAMSLLGPSLTEQRVTQTSSSWTVVPLLLAP
jgi:hypothetical protein